MGITFDDFFENIYSVIFSPKAFFERKDTIISVRLAFGNIIFVSLLFQLTSGILNGTVLKFSFIFTLILNILMTIFLWFLTTLFFEYIAKIFNRNEGLSKLLFYTSFAPIPYIFFAPLNIIKNIGDLGYIIGVTIEILLYFWIIVLYAYVLRTVYKITLSRAFMLISVPFISVFFAINWMVCFFSKMWYIFSI